MYTIAYIVDGNALIVLCTPSLNAAMTTAGALEGNVSNVRVWARDANGKPCDLWAWHRDRA